MEEIGMEEKNFSPPSRQERQVFRGMILISSLGFLGGLAVQILLLHADFLKQ
jgi:hypothetical protein